MLSDPITSTGSVADLSLVPLIAGLIGGLFIFLFGMEKLTDALKTLADGGMRKVLGKLTANRFLGALTGALVTAVIQSSSVTSVLVVGFISAGMMTLSQSVGVIMGANVGTTITAQIIAFNVTEYAMAMLALGSVLSLLGRKSSWRTVGMSIVGLSLVFLGMGQMSEAAYPLRSYQPFINLMQEMRNPLLGVLAGAAFTALVQSSSATTGIVIVLASQGFITLEAGIALTLGANVGTCITAVISAVGKPGIAKQAVAVHVLFNLLGAIIWIPMIPWLADFVREVSPMAEGLKGQEKLAAVVPRQIANAHTVFNLITTFLFIGFTGTIARLVEKVVPVKEEKQKTQAKFLDVVFLDMPELAMDRLQLEIGRFGLMALELAEKIPGGDRKDFESGLADLNILQMEILEYFRELGQTTVEERDQIRRDALLEAFQRFAYMPGIIRSLLPMMEEWKERKFHPGDETQKMFEAYFGKVLEKAEASVEAVRANDPELAALVIDSEKEMEESANDLLRHLGERLVALDPDEVAKYKIESASVEAFRRIYRLSRNGASTVTAT